MKFIPDLRQALEGNRVLTLREGVYEGSAVCEILYEDPQGRVKMIALCPRKQGNSFEDSFDEAAYVTTPRPVKKETPNDS